MCDPSKDPDVEIQHLEPKAIFGFDGSIDHGIRPHPNGKEIVFPLGSKIGIADYKQMNKQSFLSGHTNTISCLSISKSGKYLASGQSNYMGFRAYTILWNWEKKEEIIRHDVHNTKVQSVCFSAEDKYLISLGGQDDGTIIVFDIDALVPICRAVASKSTSGIATGLLSHPTLTNFFFVCGERHLRVWSILREQRKLNVSDVNMGKLQRKFTGMRIDSKCEYLYLGTMTGDVIKVRLNCCDPENVTKKGMNSLIIGAFAKHNPRKPKGKDCVQYICGVRDLYVLNECLFLIGGGDGTVELVEERNVCLKDYPNPTWPLYKLLKSVKVNGGVSTIERIDERLFIIGTDNCEIYMLDIKGFDLRLVKTCHKAPVYDIVFPKNFSSVFASASKESIRIWSAKRMVEILRIYVHNFACASLVFSHDGKCLVSAWNDGVIRTFTPVTGKLIYAIPNAHKECTSIAISSNGKLLASGGTNGQVRLWKIEPFRQSLVGVMKEHTGPISTIDFNKFDSEIVSASTDGCFIIWNISRLMRKHVVYVNTQFMCARYFPTGVQILTSGSDKMIGYFEAYDVSLVREVEGSTKGCVNSVSMNTTGEYFVSVSNDQMVKLWNYQKGINLCCGTHHAAPVLSCAYSPDGKFFVTGSADGAIMVWDVPEEHWPKNIDPFERPSEKTVSQKKSSTSVSSKLSRKEPENVDTLETVRSNKDLIFAECPPVDCKCSPDINEACNYVPACGEKDCSKVCP